MLSCLLSIILPIYYEYVLLSWNYDIFSGQVPGVKGDKGDLGPPGEKGDTGPKGEKGDRGGSGLPGIPGTNGIQVCTNLSLWLGIFLFLYTLGVVGHSIFSSGIHDLFSLMVYIPVSA
jgi:hypothetical protein